MSVYKEGFHALKTIQARSRQIWPDACDFGALTTKGDAIWKLAEQLMSWYGEKETRNEDQYATGATVTQEFSLMDEWNTGDTYYFRLTYVASKKKMKVGSDKYDGYFYVDKIREEKGNLNLDL